MVMAHSGSRILKRHGYAEIKQIGEGSFGKALLVSGPDEQKLVCKLVDVSQATKKETQDTVKEAQLLAAFKHPYIVEHCASFVEDGWLCILMAYCEGGDLTSQIENARNARQRILEDKMLRWMTQAILALKYIHDKHVLHRDLKSSNFFLSLAGNLKMGDFGIAKVLTCTQACAKTQIGTPYYLSPEVCQEKPYTWPSDIWAMGVIMYELCALKFPFDGGQNMIILVQSICRGTTPPLPEGYSDFSRQLCSEMLNKSPMARPSAGVILERAVIQGIVRQFLEEAKAAQANGGGKAIPSDSDVATKVYSTGDLVEYFSATHKAWIPARVVSTDGCGRIMVDVKPDTWISTEQQAWQIRSRAPKVEVPKLAEAPSPPEVAVRACSTQALEQMLDQVEDDGRGSPGNLVVVGEEELQEFEDSADSPSPMYRAAGRGMASSAAKAADIPQGVTGLRAPFDDECSKLCAELGLGEGSLSDMAYPIQNTCH
jgi:NIMA (never in mitosis gene a)-related kinase